MNANLDHLGERIAEQAAHLDAAMHRLLADLREFDRGGGWQRQGFRSCAQWMAWRLGWALGTSREHVRVANRVDTLPLTEEALRLGKISYSKVRAMTRVATPANEGTLLAEAGVTSATQLESICRKYSTVLRHENGVTPNDGAERRQATRRDRPDGMVRIQAVLHPEEAAVVWAALDRIATERCRASPSGDAHVPAGTAPHFSDAQVPAQTLPPPGDAPAFGGTLPHPEPASAGTTPHFSDAPIPAGTVHWGDAPVSRGSVAPPRRTDPAETSPHPDAPISAGTSSSLDDDTLSPIRRHIDEILAARGQDNARDDRWTAQPHDEASDEDGDSELPPIGGVMLSLTSMRDVTATHAARMAKRAEDQDSTRRSFDRADALVAIAEDIVRGIRKNRAPIEVILTVTAETLSGHRDAGGDPSDVACFTDGTCVSAEVARRLSCDAGVVEMVEDEHGNPLCVGRKIRTISGSMKRALLKRDRTCRFPGCATRVFLEGHHMQHWADGGTTDLRNIVSLCTHHHRFVHEYGYSIELDSGGSPRFIDDRGRTVPAVPSPAQPQGLGWDAILERNHDLEIDSATNECGYDNNPINYHYVIQDLLHADEGEA